MAGSASRIYNFCRSNPNSPGCPWPPYLGNQQPAKICDDYPYEIGTANGCSVYNVFWLKDEYTEADVVIDSWTSETSSGNTYNLVAPLYSGIYSASGPRNQIGYIKIITTQFQYNTGDKFLNTDNLSFYWINEAGKIVASMDSIYDFIGSIDDALFYPVNSTHYLNSTATNAHQLLDKRLAIKLFAGPDGERQCKLTFKR